ncbi:MAG TPA: CPBP family glutamic-type intramembrane protease [Candidatus Polarisedimenticolaceae bacterium]|nr:CPBP family glutamic-type intramembrane protease [Candidatus Polarisedimenticolaceae bacterium]
MHRRATRIAEYLLLFIALPVYLARRPAPIPVFPLLWLLAAVCLLYLVTRAEFDRRRLWDARYLSARLRAASLPFVVLAPPLAAAAWLVEPERFFGLVRFRPGLWTLVMVLYPILSVYPQGVVYRAFVFERYRGVFGGPVGSVLASAVAFGAAHLVFRNWVAPTLGLGGGLLFAWTYQRTGSSLVAAIQHAAFGCWIFTTGLGVYFYYGAVRF